MIGYNIILYNQIQGTSITPMSIYGYLEARGELLWEAKYPETLD